ncbi:type II toxin-antitoxin system HicA family toxin [Terriglobus roseus]|uniref:Predicted RNA binding protein YcfA, dsRBD-like fold, HicA-like mRNA interferase family n=1 Tax=Terriglobus roseus TaxID=392734 RepID=A0A1H4PQL1_9BACT|nr:type II toxin-antitoxin system HicA family toxin [Terriglobus roseus]SEC09743.1 Predicted RNA binding protein YcfA, dsRBD-like fold, HicA-like mRNA interferase family [Terriglobus roseus]
MSVWPSSKSKRVLRALKSIGWVEGSRPAVGSHLQLLRPGFPPFTWAFHDGEEIGPKMLARIAKQTGLQPKDL